MGVPAGVISEYSRIKIMIIMIISILKCSKKKKLIDK